MSLSTFSTTILLNEVTYEADIEGTYTPHEPESFGSPEVKASFEVEKIFIVPNDTVGEINLKAYSYNWMIDAALLEAIKSDFLTMKEDKGDCDAI